jgi:hypothetical protein
VAEAVGVTEKTVGNWVEKHNWKEQRDALFNSPDMVVKNLKELIGTITEKRMELERDPNADPKEKYRLSNEVANYTKALEAANKNANIPLSTYVAVMERIFRALQAQHPDKYVALIEFQENHLNEVAAEL